MRWAGMLAAFTIVLAAPLLAQQGQGRWSPPKSGQGLFRGITLSSEQQKQVDSIWKSHEADRERMQKARTQAQDTALMRERQQLRKKHTEEYRRVLTEDQRKVFDQNLEGMKRGGPRGKGQGQGGPPPQQHQGPPN